MSCCNTCNQPVKVCCCPPVPPTPVPPTPPAPTCIGVFDYIFDQIYPEPCTNLVIPQCKSPMEVFFEQVLSIYANPQNTPATFKIEGPSSVLANIVNNLLQTGLVISNDGSICCESCCSELIGVPYVISSANKLLELSELKNFECCINKYMGTETAETLKQLNSFYLTLPACSSDFLPCVQSILSKVTDTTNIINLGILETGNIQNVSYVCTLDAILSSITPALTSTDYQAVFESILNNGFVVACDLFEGQVFIGSVTNYITLKNG